MLQGLVRQAIASAIIIFGFGATAHASNLLYNFDLHFDAQFANDQESGQEQWNLSKDEWINQYFGKLEFDSSVLETKFCNRENGGFPTRAIVPLKDGYRFAIADDGKSRLRRRVLTVKFLESTSIPGAFDLVANCKWQYSRNGGKGQVNITGTVTPR